MSALQLTLSTLIAQYQEKNPKLLQTYDPEWRSPCEVGEPYWSTESPPESLGVDSGGTKGQQLIAWAPLARSYSNDFSGLENALETSIHPSIKEYYASYWSGPLETTAEEGHVSLLLLWNNQDVDRLIENIIGHAMAQKQSRSPLSIFFACTEPETELFISVRNHDGVIQLEKPGYKAIKELGGSLQEFLGRLSPASATPPSNSSS